MSFCHIHGSHSSDGCPECRYAEETNQQRLDDIAERLAGGGRDSGDYICPHCRYKSLRRNATRCPACHANPGAEFWARVDSQESARRSAAVAAAEHQRLQRVQKEEEWERGAPARAAAARREKSRKRATVFAQYYYGYFGPWLICAMAAFFMDPTQRAKASASPILVFPVLNWFICLGVLTRSPSVEYVVGGLLASGVATLLLWVLLKAVDSTFQALLACGGFAVLTVLLVRSSGLIFDQ